MGGFGGSRDLGVGVRVCLLFAFGKRAKEEAAGLGLFCSPACLLGNLVTSGDGG